MSIMLDRILDATTDNLRFAKILVQMGLDPNNVTWDAIFNRLLEIFLHNITLANMFALVGAIFFVATLLTHTMVPLRVANMIGCAFFAIFGALSGAVTIMSPSTGAELKTSASKRNPVSFIFRVISMLLCLKIHHISEAEEIRSLRVHPGPCGESGKRVRSIA
jgi:hypothetical protein